MRRLLLSLALALLSAWMANPASAEIAWMRAPQTGTGVDGGRGDCWVLRVSAAQAADVSARLQIGGACITIQSDGDAAGGGASQSILNACTSDDGNRDGTQDALACAGLGFRDSDGNGTLDDNTLDGGATAGRRGLLTPLCLAGSLYVDPTDATITGAEVHEVTVCRDRR